MPGTPCLQSPHSGLTGCWALQSTGQESFLAHTLSTKVYHGKASQELATELPYPGTRATSSSLGELCCKRTESYWWMQR